MSIIVEYTIMCIGKNDLNITRIDNQNKKLYISYIRIIYFFIFAYYATIKYFAFYCLLLIVSTAHSIYASYGLVIGWGFHIICYLFIELFL